MANPLLSWDDFEDDVPVKGAVNNDLALKAAESLKNLDASAGIAELEEQRAVIEKRKAMEQQGLTNHAAQFSPMFNQNNASSPSALDEANKKMQASVASQVAVGSASSGAFITSPEQMGITSDPEMAKRVFEALQNSREAFDRGEAPAVDDKRLLNCNSDLNQLIPFKYNWSWSLYLTSCEHHWMPAEVGLEKCADELDALTRNGDTSFIKTLLYRFYVNFKYRAHLYPELVALNVYRLTTNPECRQYQLRQSFESSTLHHVMDTVNELFMPLSSEVLIDKGDGILTPHCIGKEQWKIDKYSFKERYKTAINTIADLHNLEYETINEDGSVNEVNTANFLEQLIYLYGYVNWTMNIACMYQLADWVRVNGCMENIATMIRLMLRDMQTQTAFITNFLSVAFDENPFAFTDELKQRVLNTFKAFRASEDDLLCYVSSGAEQTKAVLDTFDYFVNKFLSEIGIGGYASGKLTQSNEWFIQLVESLQPKVDHEAGVTGNGGNLAW